MVPVLMMLCLIPAVATAFAGGAGAAGVGEAVLRAEAYLPARDEWERLVRRRALALVGRGAPTPEGADLPANLQLLFVRSYDPASVTVARDLRSAAAAGQTMGADVRQLLVPPASRLPDADFTAGTWIRRTLDVGVGDRVGVIFLHDPAPTRRAADRVHVVLLRGTRRFDGRWEVRHSHVTTLADALNDQNVP